MTAHDTTIVPLMVALRVPEEVLSHLPPYCAHFEFEFYQNKNGQRLVQVCYQGKPIKLANASSTMVSFEEFLEMTNWVRRTKEQFETDSKTCYQRFCDVTHIGDLDYPNCKLDLKME